VSEECRPVNWPQRTRLINARVGVDGADDRYLDGTGYRYLATQGRPTNESLIYCKPASLRSRSRSSAPRPQPNTHIDDISYLDPKPMHTQEPTLLTNLKPNNTLKAKCHRLMHRSDRFRHGSLLEHFKLSKGQRLEGGSGTRHAGWKACFHVDD